MKGGREWDGGAYLQTLGLYRLKLGMCRLELLGLQLVVQLLKLFLDPMVALDNWFSCPRAGNVNTICPAPITPRLLTSRAETAGVELKHLACLLHWSACRLRIGVSILLIF